MVHSGPDRLGAQERHSDAEPSGAGDQPFYGWYDDAEQTPDRPSYDPPHDGPCLFCGRPLRPDDVRTISMLASEGYARRSYFYRVHQTCDDRHPDDPMDDAIWAMIARNGD